MTVEDSKKVFISYSWTKKDFVLKLATQLVKDGVDVVLDMWDLREGNDKYAFMERCVKDESINKVLIVSDKVYAEKADSRTGGVGDETVIISSEMYGKTEQEKFIPIVVEKDEKGVVYLPTYLKSKIYRDLSDEKLEGPEYEKLLRNIHDKPEYEKPPIGKKPDWLNEHNDKVQADVGLIEPRKVDGEFIGKLFDDIEQGTTITWGFPDQDKMSPINKGDVVMIAGKADTNKDVYVQHIVNWNMRYKKKIMYISMAESSKNIMYSIIAETTTFNKAALKNGYLTKEHWDMIGYWLSEFNEESLKILSAVETHIDYKDVFSVVEESGVDIVVIDDLNGLLVNKSMSEEEFMYKLKWAAGKSGAVVFLVYNMKIPERRMDQRPMMEDFPSDCYYRLCDTIHFLHNVSDDDWYEYWTEVIVAKSVEGKVGTIKMAQLPSKNRLVACASNDIE